MGPAGSADIRSIADCIGLSLAAGTAANVIIHGSDGTIADADTWVDIGSSDLPIFIDFSAGTAGAGYVTVEYIQGINNA